jgi:hypothetical protein
MRFSLTTLSAIINTMRHSAVLMLSVVYAECHLLIKALYAECRYAECRGAVQIG